MKKIPLFLIFTILCMVFSGCVSHDAPDIAATTMPVADFTRMLCQGTGLTVTQLITQEVSCLHDYTLTVSQMRTIESANLIVLSGAGLEEFMEEALSPAAAVIDASEGIELLEGSCHHHHEAEAPEEGGHDHGDEHEPDAHIWLSPANAAAMARNICTGLSEQYPEYQGIFEANLQQLLEKIDALDSYAREQLRDLSSREIIPFHDGFSYLAHAYDLQILEAIEEESGSEPSALELIELIELVEHHGVQAIFVEENGSSSAASVISRETGVPVYTLTMAMSGGSWFEAMYQNIDTLKEALS